MDDKVDYSINKKLEYYGKINVSAKRRTNFLL
jgi:hypothetical protein